ncbi:MAG: radical SAM protein [Synergistaceae bacterium]|nr:radical SAM protein [Synergistaceae bacterium]
MKSIRNVLGEFALKRVLGYLDADPTENLPKIIDWIDKLDRTTWFGSAYDKLREYLDDPSNNWNLLMKSVYTDIDPAVRKKLFENFVVHAGILGNLERRSLSKREDCSVPWAMLVDPTSACNLHCIGCWAAQYGHKLSLDFETLDDIIRQGKEMGTYMYLFSGGEPLMRKKDILRLCEKHDDCVFMAFTNGTLIDEPFAREMLRVKNFVPALSVEGFEEETDLRRGRGTYQAVINAMKILQEYNLPFGFSACYHSKNTEVMGSEAFLDDMIERGCKFAWYFTYIPVGKDAVPELMATADQREYMYRQLREFRRTKPLFTLDFWNDGEYVDGCIAGGRRYLHINAAGDIEPCAFIHYADSNIREKTILEALKSPLFQQYRKNQPFNCNHLRPCPLLDNPARLAAMVHASGASSTELTAPEDVDVLTARCVPVAGKWASRAAEIQRKGAAEREATKA